MNSDYFNNLYSDNLSLSQLEEIVDVINKSFSNCSFHERQELLYVRAKYTSRIRQLKDFSTYHSDTNNNSNNDTNNNSNNDSEYVSSCILL